MRWLRAGCALLLLMAHGMASAAAPVPAACTPEVRAIAAARGPPDGHPPPPGEWQPVRLPDTWSTRWPAHDGTVWYRIQFEHDCAGALPEQVGLTLESVVMAGEVFVNGARIWRDAQLVEPLSRSWNMPRYFRLPAPLLQPGTNAILIRVVGVAGQSPGLGPVHLGPAGAMQQLHARLWWQNRTLFVANLVISAMLGLLFFCIWIVRRRQSAYGWYALMSGFWVLFVANILATTPWPLPDTLTAARFNGMMLVLYVACFCVFTWRFGDQRLARTEKALWLLSAAWLVLLGAVPQAALAKVQLGCVLTMALVFFGNCLQFQWHALRTRSVENLLLAGCLLVFFGIAVHDLLKLLHVIDTAHAYTPISSVVMTVCLCALLGLRHARNMQRIERFNDELADSIGRARHELSTTLVREHELVMSNVRLQDRLQLAYDLHDGLGGSLVRMMAMVEQSAEPPSRAQVLSFLKLIRNDLRQTIDAGSSSAVKVPETPQAWMAPLRHRFVQLFDELDMQVQWEVAPAWQVRPTALQCLALTRVVEEAMTNILKHSRARQVSLSLQQPRPDLLELRIEDDGIGFDVGAVQQAGVSVGMRSMHERVLRVGGVLDIVSRPGRTRLAVTLRLRTWQG